VEVSSFLTATIILMERRLDVKDGGRVFWSSSFSIQTRMSTEAENVSNHEEADKSNEKLAKKK